ncbi:Snaclec bothrojaracin subunit beta [Holothuria leucospilota]|uniref:Snaclec bothrojaracin subunit beta n=1 Tax=Holothuria leucospilota TaxID=206669 RepID=A0A9Q1CJC2_HOLLE|nr:Snaclec bothrojaracin subunit beta [Holothuria leucospilota]
MSTPTNNPVMSSAAPCPSRFEATGEGVSCYQLIYNQLMFTYASNYCKDIQPNAHLVSFETQVEEEWVLHLIHNMTNTSGQDYWIGLKNAVYTWEDGSYLSYANFGDKYTDNGGECLYMDVSKDSIWKGGKCTDKKKILCEYEATGAPLSPVAPMTSVTPLAPMTPMTPMVSMALSGTNDSNGTNGISGTNGTNGTYSLTKFDLSLCVRCVSGSRSGNFS